MRRRFRGLALLAALMLGGCSVLGFVYDRADWLLLREIERYLDLRPEQRAATAEALARRHAEHRREQLPAIAQSLRELAGALAVPLGAEDWARWLDQAEALLNRSLEGLPEAAAPLVATLDDAQVEGFWERLQEVREQRADEREARSSPRERAKSVERALRRWIGSLTPAQQEAVRSWAALRDPGLEDPAYESHLRQREQALRRLLADRRDPDFAARLVTFLDEDTVPATTRQRWEDERIAFVELLASISASLSDAQRERAQERLRRYARQIESLAQSDR